MTSILYLTSFGSQTLWNGTTMQAASTIDASPKAQIGTIPLANGAIYDMYQTYDAPTTPQPFDYRLLLNMPKDTAVATFETLVGLIGKRNTLTGKKDNTAGTTMTCTARLESIKRQARDTTNNSVGMLLILHFVPYDDWS